MFYVGKELKGNSKWQIICQKHKLDLLYIKTQTGIILCVKYIKPMSVVYKYIVLLSANVQLNNDNNWLVFLKRKYALPLYNLI